MRVKFIVAILLFLVATPSIIAGSNPQERTCRRACHQEYKVCKRERKHKKKCKIELRRCLRSCPR
jgi:hypothetical protein